ncbi:transcriptional regulator, ArsR family [Actinomadura meyerae]|uniref:Transcriptional regulator, ArsR family n=1 Tax=Actinomadura meyerae TaxID=240840 RepID=A0A239NVQ9_9ACTN|nr:helix-turn-helix domain-containing protein [Actinomadura meyerae]SNT58957.1 transcriptional regulator, ArsR family [Actinomadura meyerae]
MLRLWLDYDDLTRVRVTPGLSPVAQTVLSAQAPRSRRRPGLTGPSRLLLDLVPPGRWVPDFLTPYTDVPGLEAELDAVASTPVRRIRAELERSCGPRPAPWPRRLAAGDREAMGTLVRGLRDLHRVALADRWADLGAHLRAEAAGFARTMARDGVGGLLGSLHHGVRWTPPVLEIETLRDGDVHLRGRGLLLVPSPFVTGPRVLVGGNGPATVVVPAAPPAGGAGSDPLPLVFGRTRAAVLRSVADGEVTTGALAARLGVSAASASQHATALRGAGLITSERRGKTVHHALTPLGERVLRGGSPWPTGR